MKNEYKVTRELYKTWTIEGIFKGKKLAIFIVWLVVAAAAFGFGIYKIISALQGDGSAFEIIFSFAICAFGIYRAYFRTVMMSGKMYNLLAQNYGGENWQRKIEFLDNSVIMADGHKVLQNEYKNIQKISPKSYGMSILFNNGMLVRVYKDSFTNCTYDEFIEFLAKKKVN